MQGLNINPSMLGTQGGLNANFPGLNAEQIKQLQEDTKHLPESERLQAQYEIYQAILPKIKEAEQQKKRIEMKAMLYSDGLSEKNDLEKVKKLGTVRIENLVDMVKQKEGLPINTPTEELLDTIYQDALSKGITKSTMEDYINGKSDEFLYQYGLKQRKQPKESSSLQKFIAPSVSFLQGLSDVGQATVGKPIEGAAKKMLKLFGFSDEELEGLSTKGDITPVLGEAKNTIVSKGSRELGKIGGSAALTAGLPLGGGFKIAGATGKELIKNVIKRTVIEGLRGVGEAGVYNMATSGDVGDPINLGLAGGIGAAIGGPLNLIGSKLIVPGIEKLANKLQLSGLLSRTKLEKLQEILEQGGSEDLAKATPEDVANWMFQRNIKGTKQQIINKLDEIAKGADELLEETISKSKAQVNLPEAKKALEILKIDLNKPGLEAKLQEVLDLANKDTYSLSELQRIKKILDESEVMYTKSGGEASGFKAEGLRNIRRKIKEAIENTVEQEGIPGIGVRLLNNEKAMAISMKKAIKEKLNANKIGEIISFLSNRGGTSVIGGAIGSKVGPFDNNTKIGWLGNVLFGALVGRFAGSTQAKTRVASYLKKINPQQAAKIIEYLESSGEKNKTSKAVKDFISNINKLGQQQ